MNTRTNPNRKIQSRKKLRRHRKLRTLLGAIFFLCACLFGGTWIYQTILLPYFQDDREAFKNTSGTSQNADNTLSNSDITTDADIQKNNITYISKYPVGVPQARTYQQIRKELRSLADSYQEFTEIYENMDSYPQNLLAALCNNPNMIDYVKGYLNSDRTNSKSCKLTKAEKEQDFPLLIQWDNRWGYLEYGDDTIGLSGCAPTCLSMVIIGLTGDTSATPDVVSSFARKNGYYADGIGTKWSLMTEGCLEYNIIGEELKLSKANIMSSLKSGHPIICSMSAGDFTSAGHFIVLAGVKDGKIQVNDPNNRQRSEQLWDYETLAYQIKNMWVFYR